MQIDSNTTVIVFKKQSGFTLIELMIVIAIIGILVAIAYPSYQQYVIKTKRTDMMSEMHNIASEIQSRKLAQGSYSNALITGLSGDYPKQGDALYTVSFTPNPLTSDWSIIATPKNGSQMANDGTLSLNFQNIRCRGDNPNKKCGTGDEWR
ncbi:type IV pilin protein [Psychrobacter sp. JCM 18900]|uniref:type IV pilin protein n=1 Tax=Psychrobacter sp. JCM 18900 TaxID=1298608 RepID=UPI0004355135|nr:type IV pilin protein [Psychrobacter sp. JCM 18900]GAF51928.1 type IV pilin PilA [Psychrobacter sp. JCM 18900]